MLSFDTSTILFYLKLFVVVVVVISGVYFD